MLNCFIFQDKYIIITKNTVRTLDDVLLETPFQISFASMFENRLILVNDHSKSSVNLYELSQGPPKLLTTTTFASTVSSILYASRLILAFWNSDSLLLFDPSLEHKQQLLLEVGPTSIIGLAMTEDETLICTTTQGQLLTLNALEACPV